MVYLKKATILICTDMNYSINLTPEKVSRVVVPVYYYSPRYWWKMKIYGKPNGEKTSEHTHTHKHSEPIQQYAQHIHKIRSNTRNAISQFLLLLPRFYPNRKIIKNLRHYIYRCSLLLFLFVTIWRMNIYYMAVAMAIRNSPTCVIGVLFVRQSLSVCAVYACMCVCVGAVMGNMLFRCLGYCCCLIKGI